MTDRAITDSGIDEPSSRTTPRRRDLVIAWATNAAACGYLGWLLWVLWRGGRMFKGMFEGLGAELPLLTQIVIDQGFWLMPCLYGAFAGTVLVKEAFIDDKRFSTMLTCLLTIVAQWIAHGLITAYYLPLVDLMGKLS